MGDVLHALPAVTALRASLPNGWIGWAIEPQWEPLLRAESAEKQTARGRQMPAVDALHAVSAKHWARRPLAPTTLRGIGSLRRELLAQKYDVCIDLQGAIRSAWIGRMAAASRMIGEAHPREPLARWFFSERVETTGTHVIEQAREVVSAALKKDLPCCAPSLPMDLLAERWCKDWLAERGIERFVLMNPGAGWGAKRWPTERYAALAQEFRQIGYAIVVNVGPGESQLAEIICSENARAFAMSGSIGQLIASTRRASLFIGGDTGPLHLAAALQVPVVGIYGPTDPARNGPFGTAARVLRHPASKRDHSRRNEPESGLLTITVEDVAVAARELIREYSTHGAVPEPEST
jgi:heptosyltransferase-1